ncbi:MAG: hypothetical protein LBR47_03490 [Spirochaetaceae bacterium]|jgi:hypothetical protein|nr:hypothetical protein [Spirochaetaceae bacterium]
MKKRPLLLRVTGLVFIVAACVFSFYSRDRRFFKRGPIAVDINGIWFSPEDPEQMYGEQVQHITDFVSREYNPVSSAGFNNIPPAVFESGGDIMPIVKKDFLNDNTAYYIKISSDGEVYQYHIFFLDDYDGNSFVLTEGPSANTLQEALELLQQNSRDEIVSGISPRKFFRVNAVNEEIPADELISIIDEVRERYLNRD